jgi:hypothetical protein
MPRRRTERAVKEPKAPTSIDIKMVRAKIRAMSLEKFSEGIARLRCPREGNKNLRPS